MADQLFKKRRERANKEKFAAKKIIPHRYLIVCEGEKTEPHYFEGFRKIINDKIGNKIVVKGIRAERIEVYGVGRNTISLVDYTLKLQAAASIDFGHVYCVFDKDSFTDEQFNNAIIKCKENNIIPIWSNEAFELWFILHFEYLNTAIDRISYIKKLSDYFKFYSINKGKYEKNLVNIYEILTQYGDVSKAVKYAKKLEETYTESQAALPSAMHPLTMAYKLVEELQRLIESTGMYN